MNSAAGGISHSEELFIDGRWVAPSTSARLHPVNPATEQVVATVAEASEADMDKSVAAARQAFDHAIALLVRRARRPLEIWDPIPL